MSALHKEIGKRALELLPGWEQDFWESQGEKMPAYCCYPDTHLECQWTAPEQLPFYEKYCLLPDGHCIPHGLVNSDWVGSAFADGADAEIVEAVVKYYIETVIRCLQQGDPVDSARFAGTLGHFIQDACNLGHTFNNILMNRLFPGENGKEIFFHSALDSWPFRAEAVTAPVKLMGTTAEEAAFCLTEALMTAAEKNTEICIPFLTAIKSGDKEAADRFSQDMNETAVMYTANMWHTMFCLAFGKMDASEKEAFRTRDLTDSRMILSYDRKYDRQQFIDAGIPFYDTLYSGADPCRARLAVSPYSYEPTLDYAMDRKNNRLPLMLRVDGADVTGARGVAGSNYSVASFRVPGNIYRRLEVTVGVHPCSSTDGEMVVGIWCHEAKEKLLARGVTARDRDALHFTVELPEECRTVSLLSAGVPGEKSVVWLEPKLMSRIQ